MPYEHFDRRIHRLDQPTTASIRRNGSVAIRESVYLGLGSPHYIHVLFDETRGLIGIEPAPKQTLASVLLRVPAGGRGAEFRMKSCLTFLGIDHRVTRRYHAAFDYSRLVVDTSQPADMPIDIERLHLGSFKTFAARWNGRPGDMTATVGAGRIGISAAAYRELGRPTCLETYYDRRLKKIAIEATAQQSGSCYHVALARSSVSFACKSFLDYYEINDLGSHRYAAAMENGQLVIDLKASSVHVTRPVKSTPLSPQDGFQAPMAPITLIRKAS